ncbi:MAG: DUF6491 family protein [Rhodanobacteraceae bacterium]
MNVFWNVAKAGLLLAGLVAMPAWAQQTASEARDLARYERYAQAPVERVHYFQINGFEYLAPDTVAIWFGVNKMYLLTVQMPCNNLAYANGIGLTARNNMLYSKFDFVTFRRQRCQILKIRPVNELKMKQDAAKAKGAPASSG